MAGPSAENGCLTGWLAGRLAVVWLAGPVAARIPMCCNVSGPLMKIMKMKIMKIIGPSISNSNTTESPSLVADLTFWVKINE